MSVYVHASMSVDLSGAADLHCHFGPDAHRERFLGLWRQIAEHYRDYLHRGGRGISFFADQ